MKQSLFLYFLAILLFLLSSCNKDPNCDEIPFSITFNNIGINSGNFILLHDRLGTVYHELTTPLPTSKTITIDVPDCAEIDLSIGFGSVGNYLIETFQDIESGITVDNIIEDINEQACTGVNQFSNLKNIRLNIDGLSDIPKLFIPFFPDLSEPFSLEGSRLSVSGLVQTNLAHLISIQPELSEPTKSYLLTTEELLDQGADTIIINLNVEDFEDATKHSIQTNFSELWNFNAEACTPNEDVISLYRYSNSDMIEDNMLHFYLPPDFNFEQLDIGLASPSGNHFDHYSSIPSQITLIEEDINYTLAEPNEFAFETTGNFMMNKTSYKYENVAGGASSWHIYTINKNSSEVKLPQIPSGFLSLIGGNPPNQNEPNFLEHTSYNFEIPVSNVMDLYDAAHGQYGKTPNQSKHQLIKEF